MNEGTGDSDALLFAARQPVGERFAAVEQFYGINLLPSIDDATGYHCVIGAVPHEPYCRLGADDLVAMLEPGGLIADIKGMWRGIETPESYRRWQL